MSDAVGDCGKDVFEVPDDFGHGLTPPGWYAYRRADGCTVGPFDSREAAEAVIGERPGVCRP